MGTSGSMCANACCASAGLQGLHRRWICACAKCGRSAKVERLPGTRAAWQGFAMIVAGPNEISHGFQRMNSGSCLRTWRRSPKRLEVRPNIGPKKWVAAGCRSLETGDVSNIGFSKNVVAPNPPVNHHCSSSIIFRIFEGLFHFQALKIEMWQAFCVRWCAWEPGIAGSGLPDPGRSDQRTTNLDQFGTLKSRHTGRSQRIRHQHYQVPGMLTVGHCGQQFFNQVPRFKLGECSNMFKCRAQQTAVSMPKKIFVLLPPVAP